MMKKFITMTATLKAFAAMLFAGFICLYMIGGVGYSMFIDGAFDFTISFIHLVMAIGFTMSVSLLWGVCFGHVVIKKRAFVSRYALFVFMLVMMLAITFLYFSFLTTPWNPLWLTTATLIVAFVMVLSVVSEWYFKKTGEHYTDVLRIYQSQINTS